MNAPAALLLLFLAITAVIVALNWGALLTQATLSIGIASVSAPVGLLLFGFAVLLTAIFLIVLLTMQTAVFRAARLHARELQAQRELADQAEASRFVQLREYQEQYAKNEAVCNDEFKTALWARLDALEAALRATIETSGNTMGAYIGELEERLRRRDPGAS